MGSVPTRTYEDGEQESSTGRRLRLGERSPFEWAGLEQM